MLARVKQLIAYPLLLLLTSNAFSATIVVNTDPVGVGCTIIDAINSANANSPLGGCLLTTTGAFGDDTIVIPESQNIHSLFAVNNTAGALGDNGLPQITSNIVIEGNNALIQRSLSPGAPDFRIFYVGTGGDLTLRNVRLANGKENNGSAMFVYGGKAKIEDSVVRQNTATSTNGSGFPDGYTIASFAVGAFDTELQLNRTEVTDNTGGGIISTRSGSTTGSQQLLVRDSVVSDNSNSGVFVSSGNARIDRSEISFNQSSGVRTGNNVIMTVRDSTISNNKSSSSISTGGGVAIVVGTGTPTTNLINNTITENEAASGGGIRHALGTLTMVNNIISGNTTISAGTNGKEILRHPGFSGGTPTTGNQRNNLIGMSAYTTAQAMSGISAHASDLLATSNGTIPTPINRIMSGLKNNGSVGRTHALVDGSPAIDAAVSTYSLGVPFIFGEGCAFTILFPTFSVVTRDDQRGVERPQQSACDIGAHEQEETMFYVIPMASGGSVIFEL
jgi:hypothetical protein